MATYQQTGHNYGYPPNANGNSNSDSSYPSSSTNQHVNQQYSYPQQQQQQHQQQQQQQHHHHQQQTHAAGNNYYAAVPNLENGYYGFADAHNQHQHQSQQQYLFPPSQGLNGHGSGNGNTYGQPNMNGLTDYYQQNADYDPFALGVLTGPGMYFNPSSLQQFQVPQQSYYSHQTMEQPIATTSHLHRPSHPAADSPSGSLPGSVQSSHLNLHSITPDRSHTLTPDGDREANNGSPLPASGPVRPMGRYKEGPVKAACLSCRQKKAKCDGVKPICTQCSKKNLECVYVKSKRGGARKKREPIPPSALQEFLKKLDGLLSVHDPSLSPGTTDENEDTTSIVRSFASRDEVFRCYYNEVHPFIPVMPPRTFISEIQETLLPESPFLLAAETILVLVPHPLDPNPKSSNSKRLRTAASAALGKRTMDAIEAILGANERSLEVPQAFAMLSMWEWGNAGNLQLNRMRANQATQVMMEMGINVMDKNQHANGRALEGEDWRKDMARRTWWAAYAGQMTAAIISGNEPILGPDDPRVHIAYPVCSHSDTAWPNWINAMRQCVRVFSIVNAVYAESQTSSAWGGSSPSDAAKKIDFDKLKRKMLEVDAEVMGLMQQAEKSAVIELVPGGEEEVVRNQQLSARLGLAVTHIHIHRQQAFPEVSLFSKRICGLPQAPDFSPPGQLDGPEGNALPDTQALSNDLSMLSTSTDGHELPTQGEDYDFIDEMWEPETYPEDLPAPWFTNRGGAGSLYAPTHQEPNHIPLTASIVPIKSPQEGRRSSIVSSQQTNGTQKPHKAWGVDKDDKTSPAPEGLGISKAMQVFPPGISLARCAAAAHTIVRLEVLHRSAVIAMWDGPPKWLPFCSCGLVTGAYAFLLLALAVQADNEFATNEELVERSEEVEALLTNVKVILAGLEAYGVMWAGIEVMAGEVRAALEAASRLPYEIRGQIETVSSTASPPPGQLQTRK